MSKARSPREVCSITIGIRGLMRVPRRRMPPPGEARLGFRLTPLAAGACARGACPYCGYCPAHRSLGSLASDARETRRRSCFGRCSCRLLLAGGPQFRIGNRLLLLRRPQLLAGTCELERDPLHLRAEPIDGLAQAKVLANRLAARRGEHLLDRLLLLTLFAQRLGELLVGDLDCKLLGDRLQNELARDRPRGLRT